jgi:AraC-like DNA-binding protein
MELLLQIESIAEVGFKMGFSDQSHFSRFFKKNVGLTPRQYLVINKPGMS